jgi:cytochrome b subunit of formate dehydrogenase
MRPLIRGGFFAIVLASLPVGVVLAEECIDCHLSGADRNAPVISASGESSHAGLKCRECHPGDDMPPCPPRLPPVRCDLCHQDEVKALGSSSHGKKIIGYLKEKQGKVKLNDVCSRCHGDDVHHLRKKDDALSPSNRTNIYKTCLGCHEEVQPIAIHGYVDSIHGIAASGGNLRSAVCTDCHGGHFIEGMTFIDSSVFYTTIPETCGKCHANEYSEYVESKHWKTVENGFREAPVCTDCHGEHGIRSRRDPLSPAWVGNITKTCAGCHESEMINAKFMMPEGMVKSFQDSYHGLSGNLGDVRVANCSSCHGNHAILPASDPRSTISPANLGKTCGGCHPGAERRFISEPIHKIETSETNRLSALVRNIYILLIVCTIGGMFAHNLLDLFFKSTRGFPYHKQTSLDPRFSINERAQHATLAISFILLAVSGFALRFPDSLVGMPFQLFEAGADYRRWLHRGAAAVFVVLSVYHLLYLAATVRGRSQVREILPGLRDVRDALNVLMNYLGRSEDKITLPHYSYVEKAEYWALIWGAAVMTATGLLLAFTDYILSFLPLWAVDLAATIHFWEAVLAVSAIIVWHGYWVIFDPEYYPMNLTWLYGRPRKRSHDHQEHPGTAE